MNISMLGLQMGALARRLIFCAAPAMVVGVIVAGVMVAGLAGQAGAQSGALPQDVSQALDLAIELSEIAAKNAAFSAEIADASQQSKIAERTRLSIAQSNLAEAVVSGIARHPQSVQAIVAAAVQRAPDHAPIIVHRAIIAFPLFAPLIAAGAGMSAPPQMPLVLPYMIPAPTQSTYVPAPSTYVPTPYGPAPYVQPRVYAQPLPAPVVRTTQAVVLPAPTMAVPTAATPIMREPTSGASPYGISELRFGVVHHDTGVVGHNKEGSADITMAVRFLPLRGDIWEFLGNPRPFIGANINTSGETSTLFFGGNWDWPLWRQTFLSFAAGGAAHTGEIETSRLDRKELGSRVLFYLAFEAGYRFSPRHSLAMRIDHMSNAKLADKNEGLDTVGLVYGYHF